MTPIDHQQAAVDGVEAVLQDEYGGYQYPVAKRAGRAAVEAALPAIHKQIAEEVRDLRSQFHDDDAKTAFGRIGSSTEAYLNALDDVLTISTTLKGHDK